MSATAPFDGRESFVGAEPELVEAVARTRGLADRDLGYFASRVESLFEHLQGCGITRWSEITGELVLQWAWGEVEHRNGSRTVAARNTARNRQLEARTAFTAAAELGASVDPRTAAGPKIVWVAPDRSARFLTDRELRRICDASVSKRKTAKRPLLVAFSLASGTAENVGSVRAKDVDLQNRTVRFRGTNARVCALDDWSVHAIAKYLKANPVKPNERLCVRQDLPSQRAAHAVTSQLCAILKAAGFSGDSGVSARSIRLTAARRVLERDGIVVAAKFLGSPSLDNTAALLDHAWQRPAASAVEGTRI